MNIAGFQKTTLLDYPNHIAATIFFKGCNFRCPFCHNGNLVLFPEQVPVISTTEILAHLKKRRGILDGVCISGGEPTLQPKLAGFLHEIKNLGFLVKLDTNGYRPAVLKNLYMQGLVDYVAMDIKGPPSNYSKICGITEFSFHYIQESIDFLMENKKSFEFRTTVVKELHNKDAFESIGEWIQGAPAYYLQGYQSSPQVIFPGFSSYTRKELEAFQKILKEYIPLVQIRGMDD